LPSPPVSAFCARTGALDENLRGKKAWNLKPQSFEISSANLESPDFVALIHEHMESAAKNSPPGGVRALDVAALRAPEVSVWSLFANGHLAGCGAIKELNQEHGEIKSMRTATKFLRQGVASFILDHLIHQARQRGYCRLSLETGATESFAAARALYSRFGFAFCGPSASYVDESFSVYMTRDLTV